MSKTSIGLRQATAVLAASMSISFVFLSVLFVPTKSLPFRGQQESRPMSIPEIESSSTVGTDPHSNLLVVRDVYEMTQRLCDEVGDKTHSSPKSGASQVWPDNKTITTRAADLRDVKTPTSAQQITFRTTTSGTALVSLSATSNTNYTFGRTSEDQTSGESRITSRQPVSDRLISTRRHTRRSGNQAVATKAANMTNSTKVGANERTTVRVTLKSSAASANNDSERFGPAGRGCGNKTSSIRRTSSKPTSNRSTKRETSSWLTTTADRVFHTSSRQPNVLSFRETQQVKSFSSFVPQSTTVRRRTSRTVPRTTPSRADPQLKYHGGRILPKVVTKNIFWGTSWANYTGDKITGMDNFSSAWNNSAYARTILEYNGSDNEMITPFSTHLGHVIDTSMASGGSNSDTILAEVCAMISDPDPGGNGFYAVFTDVARGSADYCSFHSWGKCCEVQVQFAFFWKLDGDSGCDPQSNVPGQSQGLAALANLYAHELAEATTDPNGNAWLDAKSEENADKCAWTFISPFVTLSDGSQWKLQSEWSNRAFLAGTGYANFNGEKGCIESA